MTRFLRPTGPDTYEAHVDGEIIGTVLPHTGLSGGYKWVADNGDTTLFGLPTPQEAALDMLRVREAGGAGAVQIAYERANGWSTD